MPNRPDASTNRCPTGWSIWSPTPAGVRGVSEGRVVVDSEGVLLVHRPGLPPTYTFPAAAVGQVPSEPVPDAAGYVRVAWDVVDEWYEEEEQVFMHPRNPYHRVDCVPTSRRLRVVAEGVVLVDSTTTIGVYETSLPPRLYVSREQLPADVLTPSSTTTYCPYKGTATYWSADVGGERLADVAWSYDRAQPGMLGHSEPCLLRRDQGQRADRPAGVAGPAPGGR